VIFYDLLAYGEAVMNSIEFSIEDFHGVAHWDGFIHLVGQAIRDTVACPCLSLKLRAVSVGNDVIGIGVEVMDE
jgi:hypothetical protein